MASEFFAEGGNKIALKLTPGVGGILQVFVDGDKIFDKKRRRQSVPGSTASQADESNAARQAHIHGRGRRGQLTRILILRRRLGGVKSAQTWPGGDLGETSHPRLGRTLQVSRLRPVSLDK